MEYNRKIVLEGGEEFYGYAFGPMIDKVCEIVFNTSMAGYQEILSDPSYTGQAVVMTYPLIGNYGMAAEDYESVRPSAGALIVKEYNDKPSCWRSKKTLAAVMEAYQIPGICGVDTRRLTRSIRDHGSRKCILCPAAMPLEEAVKRLKETVLPKDVVSRVSCRKAWTVPAPAVPEGKAKMSLTDSGSSGLLRIVAIDCGIKLNILRSFQERGISVQVVPWDTAASEIDRLRPDGIFISNGPGNPADVPQTIRTVKSLLGRYPMFGICLGHQIIALAYGAKVYKLKFGHRGGNHPVKNLKTGKIEITSQNHSYAVDPDSLSATPLIPTHINLLDQTLEGLECPADRAFSIQYHPESAPGPQDSAYLFDHFIDLM